MALYTILFGISIFMIALVIAVIENMFFHWKHEHTIERTLLVPTERPAVSLMIRTSRCFFKCRQYNDGSCLYDIIDKTDSPSNGFESVAN